MIFHMLFDCLPHFLVKTLIRCRECTFVMVSSPFRIADIVDELVGI